MLNPLNTNIILSDYYLHSSYVQGPPQNIPSIPDERHTQWRRESTQEDGPS